MDYREILISRNALKTHFLNFIRMENEFIAYLFVSRMDIRFSGVQPTYGANESPVPCKSAKIEDDLYLQGIIELGNSYSAIESNFFFTTVLFFLAFTFRSTFCILFSAFNIPFRDRFQRRAPLIPSRISLLKRCVHEYLC